MEAQFEFNKVLIPQSLVDLEDIGDFALECYNDDTSVYFYIVGKTKDGFTTFYTWGPVIPDLNMPIDKYFFNIKIMEYKEKKVINYINSFLNGGYGITEAKLITIEEAIEQAKNEKEFLLYE